MTDLFRSPFVFADEAVEAAKQRRRGLLGPYLPLSPSRYAAPIRWRSKNGTPLDREARLPAMRRELDRLLALTDPDDDRYRQIAFAAAVGDALAENTNPQRREEYFSIFSVFYGRLEEPRGRLLPDYDELNSLMARIVDGGSKGGSVSALAKKAKADERRTKAQKMRDQLLTEGKAKHEIPQIIAKRMKVTARTVRDWLK